MTFGERGERIAGRVVRRAGRPGDVTDLAIWTLK